jgi:hypothetical protein
LREFLGTQGALVQKSSLTYGIAGNKKRKNFVEGRVRLRDFFIFLHYVEAYVYADTGQFALGRQRSQFEDA